MLLFRLPVTLLISWHQLVISHFLCGGSGSKITKNNRGHKQSGWVKIFVTPETAQETEAKPLQHILVFVNII